ncbi:hypothetical protein [Hydrogenimonas urashimensis]|uniref:hypothetical protein n=1 Tax=Hydrogenimonas urashimensis TaxID=2740515 RepID=UPI001F19BA4C|nr:hypothetical protein [Hydrogenimonas urashimensis]
MQTTKRPTFANFKKKALQNEEVRKEYDALKPLFAIKNSWWQHVFPKGLRKRKLLRKSELPNQIYQDLKV